jgi:hypothetical protein
LRPRGPRFDRELPAALRELSADEKIDPPLGLDGIRKGYADLDASDAKLKELFAKQKKNTAPVVAQAADLNAPSEKRPTIGSELVRGYNATINCDARYWDSFSECIDAPSR